jgi:hypothetical protein
VSFQDPGREVVLSESAVQSRVRQLFGTTLYRHVPGTVRGGNARGGRTVCREAQELSSRLKLCAPNTQVRRNYIPHQAPPGRALVLTFTPSQKFDLTSKTSLQNPRLLRTMSHRKPVLLILYQASERVRRSGPVVVPPRTWIPPRSYYRRRSKVY